MSEYDLFTKPISEINYEMVDEFCKLGREEDIDLDYKRDWPNDLDRLLCAFANTQGGLVLIGIDEQNKSRRPICPPKGVEGDVDPLRQRVLNIAFDKVYPPIQPKVYVCKIPESDNKNVVVIRVEPTRRMHAVNHRRRIYIRSADNNRPYELASISDLEWLWSQREKDEMIKDELLSIAIHRSDSPIIEWDRKEYKEIWLYQPRLIITSSPSFPSLVKPILPSYILKTVKDIGIKRSKWREFDRKLPWQAQQWRSVSGGICLKHRGINKYQQYIELEQHGFCYVAISILLEDFQYPHNFSTHSFRYMWASKSLAYVDLAISFISDYYNRIGFRYPVTLSAHIEQSENTYFTFTLPKASWRPVDYMGGGCPDNRISLFTEDINGREIPCYHQSILFNAFQAMAESNGVNWEEIEQKKWFDNLTSS